MTTHARLHQRPRYPGSIDPLTRGPFDPTVPSDLAFWYDVPNLGLANNALIDSLTDRSGNALHATQATEGYRPTNLTNQQNGRAAALFGSDDYLSIPAPGGGWTGTADTTFMVLKTPTAWANQIAIGGPSNYYIGYFTSAALVYYAAAGYNYLSHGMSLDTWHIVAFRRSGTSWEFWRDGAYIGATTCGSGIQQPVALGRYTTSYYMNNYKFGDITHHRGTLSPTEMAEMFGFLNNRWAVY